MPENDTSTNTVAVNDQRELAKAGWLTPAYLLSVEIENFRCFKKSQVLQLTDSNGLPAQWTIIIGENGTGKTTLLECIASLLPITTGQRKVDEDSKRPGGHIDFGYLGGNWENYFNAVTSKFHLCANLHLAPPLDDKAQQKASVTVERLVFDDVAAFLQRMENTLTEATLHVTMPVKPIVTTMKVLNADERLRNFFVGNRQPYFSLIAAYGASRLGQSSDSVSLSDPEAAGPTASLFSLDAKLRNAEEWLLQVDYASRVSRSKKTRNRHRLSHVKKALLRMLPEILDIEIIASKEGALPSVQFKTRFGDHSLRQLSLGYQTTVAWIVDLASRMMDHYPGLKNFLDQPAVVLIDEIDLHMHPKWQRQIMSLLSSVFPRVQFIATSHSPLVVQAVERANTVVLLCEDDHAIIRNDQKSVNGWRVDQILTSDLFGLNSARAPQIEELLERRKGILTKGRLTRADRTELDEINKKIGPLPTGDTGAEQGALDIINRAAERLKPE